MEDPKLEHPFYFSGAGDYQSLGQTELAPWSLLIQQLQKYAVKRSAHVYIPVTNESFEDLKYRSYNETAEEFVKKGYMYASAKVAANVVMVDYCIEHGDRGDDGGFGMEPDTWIYAVLDFSGKYIVPFTLKSEDLKTVNICINMNIPPLDENGKLQKIRYEDANDKDTKKCFIKNLCGLVCGTYVYVPCRYKEIEVVNVNRDSAGVGRVFSVQSVEGKYGLIVPFSKKEDKEDIPTVYCSQFRCVTDNIVTTTREDNTAVFFKITKEKITELTQPPTIVTNGTTGNLLWSLSPNGTLTITGTGAMEDYGNDYFTPPWYNNRTLINTLNIGNGITTIGENAFGGCRWLQSVTIPDSVTSIGYHAFRGCALTSIPIANSVTRIGKRAFAFCGDLKSVTLPNSVVEIGDEVFFQCAGLKSVTIPNSVTHIGDYVFTHSKNLREIINHASTPQIIGEHVPRTVNSECVLYVPETSVEKYRTADVWKEFINICPIVL